MMIMFFGVMTEIYDDDSVKVSPLYCRSEIKPDNELKVFNGVTVYKDWYETESAAELALAKRKESVKIPA